MTAECVAVAYIFIDYPTPNQMYPSRCQVYTYRHALDHRLSHAGLLGAAWYLACCYAENSLFSPVPPQTAPLKELPHTSRH